MVWKCNFMYLNNFKESSAYSMPMLLMIYRLYDEMVRVNGMNYHAIDSVPAV